jgi:ubiquinone/menaquinone biosynthesis C-methylase UbiE
MATILRDWSFRYPPIYEAIASVAALLVGGDRRFRRVTWDSLNLPVNSQVLDLCCGPGGATRYLVQDFAQVTALDASEVGLKRVAQKAPSARCIQSRAESMPFEDNTFDLVHTSMAMHEMRPEQLRTIFQEVLRILQPGGTFAMIDFHAPTMPLLWPGLAIFLWVFETQTAWQLLKLDLPQVLGETGFQAIQVDFLSGGSLQIVRGQK